MPFLTIHQMVAFPTDGGTQTLVHVAEDQLLGFFSKLFYFYIEAFRHWTLLWLIHFIVEFHFTELFAQREEIFITSSKSFKRTEWPSLIAAWQLAST